MRKRLQTGRDRAPKFYFYKMTVDDGGAPCVQDGLLTLAICKPTVRRVAPEGSVIIAFAGGAWNETELRTTASFTRRWCQRERQTADAGDMPIGATASTVVRGLGR